MKLFTYGTLTGDHYTMGNATFLGKSTTVKEYHKGQNNWYPYLLEKSQLSTAIISGNLWEIPEEDFGEIDRYEGAPDLFDKKLIEVKNGDIVVQAYCYFIDPKEI